KVQLGRSPTTTTRFKDTTVSRVHCEVLVEEDRALVVDLNSSGGTFVNNERVSQGELQPGDVIRLGATQIRFEADEPGAAEAPGTKAAEPPTEIGGLTGHIISHYEVGDIVARGKSSLIFRARDTRDNNTVALKVMQRKFSQGEEEVQRFVRAMKTMLPL